MNSEAQLVPTPEAADAVQGSGTPLASTCQEVIPENWKALFTELTAYYRRLPELLAQGNAGRYVVVKGDSLCNVWDSYRDALQYGHERFGDQLFMVHCVDPRDMERLARFFPAKGGPCPG
jgi:hypothetical protein